MSEIQEEEMDIKQSGLSKMENNINNSNIASKEFPIEEKKPEEALPSPENVIENNNQKNSIQQSISSVAESAISDSQLDHMPTISSIMRGDSKPLPPAKNKKYQK